MYKLGSECKLNSWPNSSVSESIGALEEWLLVQITIRHTLFMARLNHFILQRLNHFGLRVEREGWWFEHSMS